ncbi:MAG: VWA domain-containing protein [Saprospiraceae bacterium]|nr:VWA domain-containing protein [Saprospiraceae bacterium]
MISYLKNIEFVDPWLLVLAIPPLVWYVWKLLKKKNTDTTFTLPSRDPVANTVSLRSRMIGLPDVFRLVGLVFLVLALARPQLTLKEEEVKAEGIDIMLAIDLSSSMLAKDFEPDRLEVSKAVAIDFVNKRPYDRMGLAVFAGEAFTQCPLTTDQSILKDFLESIAVGTLADGTAIGMGLATAVNRLKDSESKSKIVILLTDGVNNTGYIDPETASEIAEEYDVKVYTIGVGSEGNAMTPVNRRSNGQYVFRMARVQIDEALLKEISKNTGGRYFRATDREDLENIYAEIDRLEKTEIEVNVFKRYEDEFRNFLLIGLVFIALDLLLRNTVLNVLS